MHSNSVCTLISHARNVLLLKEMLMLLLSLRVVQNYAGPRRWPPPSTNMLIPVRKSNDLPPIAARAPINLFAKLKTWFCRPPANSFQPNKATVLKPDGAVVVYDNTQGNNVSKRPSWHQVLTHTCNKCLPPVHECKMFENKAGIWHSSSWEQNVGTCANVQMKKVHSSATLARSKSKRSRTDMRRELHFAIHAAMNKLGCTLGRFF